MKKKISVLISLLLFAATQLSARDFFVRVHANPHEDRQYGARTCNWVANYSIYVGFTNSNMPQPALQGIVDRDGKVKFQMPEQELIAGQSVPVRITKICSDRDGNPAGGGTLSVNVSASGGDEFNF